MWCLCYGLLGKITLYTIFLKNDIHLLNNVMQWVQLCVFVKLSHYFNIFYDVIDGLKLLNLDAPLALRLFLIQNKNVIRNEIVI